MLYYNTNLEFIGATLLDAKTAIKLLSKKDREFDFPWWLCSPGNYNYLSSSFVNNDGSVFGYGNFIQFCYHIRPALIINELGMFKTGDIFSIGKYYFKIISPLLAWMYKQDIGADYFDEKSNIYNSSHIKTVVDAWYETLKDEIK